MSNEYRSTVDGVVGRKLKDQFGFRMLIESPSTKLDLIGISYNSPLVFGTANVLTVAPLNLDRYPPTLSLTLKMFANGYEYEALSRSSAVASVP